jgi:multidrug resistance efflux pump
MKNFITRTSNEKYKIHRSNVKKYISKWQWYIVIALVTSPILYVGWSLISDKWFIDAHGSVVTEKYVIKAQEDGYIEESYLRSGVKLDKGSTAFIIRSPELMTEYNKISSQIEDIEKLKKDLQDNDIQSYEDLRKAAEEYVDRSREFYDKMVKYRKQELINIFQLQQASKIFHDASMELYKTDVEIEKNKAQFKLQVENTYLDDTQRLELRGSILKERIDDLSIKMQSGAVTNQVQVFNGEYVQKGDILATLSLTRKPFVRAYLDYKYISYVHKGTPVTVKYDDGTKFDGTVTSKPVFAENDKRDSNTFSQTESKIVVIVDYTTKPPQKYSINNMPVTINFKRL